MSQYFSVIQTAFLTFPVIAAVITLPYMVVQYKKYGAIPMLRSAVVYSFALYLISIYFLAILPLPELKAVEAMTSPTAVLAPMDGIREFITKYSIDLTRAADWLKLLKSSSAREIFFNICMFFPLGVYLRYYFRRPWWQVLLLGFCGSLFLELTQLTGLYGIYPRPYRLFDINDLVNNTLGAMIGFWCTPFVCFFLPSRDKLDERAYRKGTQVPFLRRGFALVLDWAILGVLYQGFKALGVHFFPILHQMQWAKSILYCICILVYFVLIPFVTAGRTPAKAFFKMRITAENGRKPSFGALLVRYTILYGLIVPAPVYAVSCIDFAFESTSAAGVIAGIGGAFLLTVLICTFCAECLMKLLGSKKEFLYGMISRTALTSTIKMPENDCEIEQNTH